MATEHPALRPVVVMQPPPCERSFVVHYRDDQPIGLVIDDQPYSVKRVRRGTGVHDGDRLLTVVEVRPRKLSRLMRYLQGDLALTDTAE